VSGPLRIAHAATRDNLGLFLDFIDHACTRIAADADTRFALRLAVEEVCTNLIQHGHADRDPGPIEIAAQRGHDRVTLTIRDHGRPFDPARAPPPDLTSDAESRQTGGLGWHLVKQLMDEIHYSADAQGGNLLTLVKRTATSTPRESGDGNGD
jgi:serine/threonine-protein kinase RsbW